jgi:hypothetical protein
LLEEGDGLLIRRSSSPFYGKAAFLKCIVGKVTALT